MADNYFGDISEKEIEWLKKRWSMFTGSKIAVLNNGGTRPMTEDELKIEKSKGGKRKTVDTLFGTGAITYIETVASEAVTEFNTEGGFETRASRKGKINEPASFYVVERMLGLSGTGILQYCGGENPIFKHYDKDSGVSPDFLGVEADGKISFGGELKNPDPKKHFYYLRKMRNSAELAREEPDFYGQCQFAMMSYKVDYWLFASYNEYMKNFADRLLLFKVEANKPYQTNLKMRLKIATKMKYELIEELNTRRLA